MWRARVCGVARIQVYGVGVRVCVRGMTVIYEYFFTLDFIVASHK